MREFTRKTLLKSSPWLPLFRKRQSGPHRQRRARRPTTRSFWTPTDSSCTTRSARAKRREEEKIMKREVRRRRSLTCFVYMSIVILLYVHDTARIYSFIKRFPILSPDFYRPNKVEVLYSSVCVWDEDNLLCWVEYGK